MNRKIGILFVMMVWIAGCAPQPSAPAAPLPADTATPEMPVVAIATVQATVPPMPTSAPQADDQSCDNPFYPVSDEATWTYDLATGGRAVHVMSVDENGAFTLHIQGDESSFTIDGDCTDEGIVLMNTPGAMTTVNSSDGNAVVSTVDVAGVTLPNDVKINDQWSQTINVTTGDQKSVVYSEYTALGFENITVPAGNFYTLKVEQSGYVEIFGQKIKMHGYQWFAEGVGTVKSEMDGATVAELVSYDIPD